MPLKIQQISTIHHGLSFILQEYEAAKALFKGKEGKELKKKLVKKSNQFVPGEGLESRKANGTTISYYFEYNSLYMLSFI